MGKDNKNESNEKAEPEKTILVMTRKAALGNGTREPGFVLGKIKDPKKILSIEGITRAEGVESVEILNALANRGICEAQAPAS